MLVKSIILLQVVLCALAATTKYQFPREWHAWKETHGKSYQDEEEELRKHVVWKSNAEYIKQHNLHDHVFGYTLEMNEYGDLVSTEMLCFIFDIPYYFCCAVCNVMLINSMIITFSVITFTDQCWICSVNDVRPGHPAWKEPYTKLSGKESKVQRENIWVSNASSSDFARDGWLEDWGCRYICQRPSKTLQLLCTCLYFIKPAAIIISLTKK